MTGGRRSWPTIWLAVLCSLAAITGGASATDGPSLGNAAGSPVDAEAISTTEVTVAARTAALTPIEGCEAIEEPGRYVLTRNVTNNQGTRTSQNCVWINASDVVLEGAGHVIDGVGVSDSTGVYVGSKVPLENVTVRNLTASDWHKGVRFRNVSSGSIEGVNATGNAFGLSIENASDTAILDNEVVANLIGIRVHVSANIELSGTDARSNRIVGIYGEVTAIDVFGTEITVGPPLDHTGDGRYEDVTGDGDSGVSDVLALFAIVSADAVGISDLADEQRGLFDFDHNGRLSYGDVWALMRN